MTRFLEQERTAQVAVLIASWISTSGGSMTMLGTLSITLTSKKGFSTNMKPEREREPTRDLRLRRDSFVQLSTAEYMRDE